MTPSKLAYLVVAVLALSLGVSATIDSSDLQPGAEGARASDDSRPNIVLIVSDDQRYDTMDYMPRTRSLIFDEGVTFQNAYVTTSRCCPSRSSILTGMYAHTHGVLTNGDALRQDTIVQALHAQGYFTGLVGKYLNSYPTRFDAAPLPEFDFWVGMASGNQARYFDTRLNVDGVWREHSGYQTYILRDYALAFLQEAGRQDKPFFLLFTPYAPHLPAVPAPGDEELYPDLAAHRPPNFNPDTLDGKPDWMQAALPRLTAEQIETLDSNRANHVRSLNALDEAVESLVAELGAQGELDNTLIVYISDNGIFWGEHRFPVGKAFVYEESVKVPFGVRYPPLVSEPGVDTHLVANIDIAPTLYELAHVPAPDDVDGLSLVPLLEGGDDWRDYLLIEGWPTGVAYVGHAPWFVAVHTSDYVYVETRGDRPELYDLASDPYELSNEVDNPRYADVAAELRGILDAEQAAIPRPPITSGAHVLVHTYRTVMYVVRVLWADSPGALAASVVLAVSLAAFLFNYRRIRRLALAAIRKARG